VQGKHAYALTIKRKKKSRVIQPLDDTVTWNKKGKKSSPARSSRILRRGNGGGQDRSSDNRSVVRVNNKTMQKNRRVSERAKAAKTAGAKRQA